MIHHKQSATNSQHHHQAAVMHGLLKIKHLESTVYFELLYKCLQYKVRNLIFLYGISFKEIVLFFSPFKTLTCG